MSATTSKELRVNRVDFYDLNYINQQLAKTDELSFVINRLYNAINGGSKDYYYGYGEQIAGNPRSRANQWLRLTVDRLRKGFYSYDMDVERIQSMAANNSRFCQKYITSTARIDEAVAKADKLGLDIPATSKKISLMGIGNRLSDAGWWSRQWRKVAKRKCEALLREMALVQRCSNRKLNTEQLAAQTIAAPYVSNYIFSRWKYEQSKGQEYLQSTIATNDDGQEYELSELAKLGTSNPEIRRGELMLRMNGFEQWAEGDVHEWLPMFYTITTPSKYHAVTNGRVNKKFAGYDPADGQRYLCRIWAQIRAKFKREGIEAFGFRVAEPHHDGTPHWHMLLFLKAEQEPIATSIIRDYALREDCNEKGAKKYRFEAVKITPERGSAAGYIAKYVAKNVDGFAVDFDIDARRPALDTAARVKCWASVWGIRQFQQIGGAQVTVWRELRRWGNEHQDNMDTYIMGGQNSEYHRIVGLAMMGNWNMFTEAMGGAVAKRADRPIQPFYEEKTEKDATIEYDIDGYAFTKAAKEPVTSKYDGVGITRLVGLVVKFASVKAFEVVTRWRNWTIERKDNIAQKAKNTISDLVADVMSEARDWAGEATADPLDLYQ